MRGHGHTENQEKKGRKSTTSGSQGRISAGKWQDRRKKREKKELAKLSHPVLPLDPWAGGAWPGHAIPAPRVLLDFTAPSSLRGFKEGWEWLPGTRIRPGNHWDEGEGPSRPLGAVWGVHPRFYPLILAPILVLTPPALAPPSAPGPLPGVPGWKTPATSTGGRREPGPAPPRAWGSPVFLGWNPPIPALPSPAPPRHSLSQA